MVSRPKPFMQDEETGLCGLYAIVNAIVHLYPGKREQVVDDGLIGVLADSIGPDKFLEMFKEGCERPELDTMLEAAEAFCRDTLKVELAVGYPMDADTPKSARDYWDRLLPLIEPANAVAIIGIDDPDPHWSVLFKAEGHTGHLFDSSIYERINLRRTMVLDDVTPGKTKQSYWQLDPIGVAVLSRPG